MIDAGGGFWEAIYKKKRRALVFLNRGIHEMDLGQAVGTNLGGQRLRAHIRIGAQIYVYSYCIITKVILTLVNQIDLRIKN
jgi:hypothetical protein